MAAIKIIIVINIITIAQNHVLTFADVVPEIIGIFYSIWKVSETAYDACGEEELTTFYVPIRGQAYIKHIHLTTSNLCNNPGG